MKKIIVPILVIVGVMLTSCSDDNNPEKKGVTAPETYTFERQGSNTVSFSGQTTRIKMASEIVKALKDTDKTKESIMAMFAHQKDANDFSNLTLNPSNKNVRSKVAASMDYFATNTTDANAIKTQFDTWIKEQVDDVFPNWNVEATPGIAGGLQEAGGGSTRYINSKGVEINQLFAKGLIGALMVDQILNNYLSIDVLDAGDNVADNNNDKLVEQKLYTLMEHKWDEAYGYLYGAEEDPAKPVLGADSFLNKYLSRVDSDNDFKGIASDIFNAFKLGRAAIVAKNYDVRNHQIKIIREKISKVIAIRAVYYLQQGKEKWNVDKAAAFHDISEGLGFVYSLQFTRKSDALSPYFTKSEVDSYLNSLLNSSNGLWNDNTPDTLDTISNKIAAKFDFTVLEAAK